MGRGSKKRKQSLGAKIKKKVKDAMNSFAAKDEIVRVIVVDDDLKSNPEPQREVIFKTTNYYLNKLKELFPNETSQEKGDEITLLNVPRKYYRQKEFTRNFKPSMCGWHATQDFCQNILGIKLDRHDEKYYESHPLLQSEGLPMADTLRVIQETISPYELRIIRVRMMPGVSLAQPLRDWQQILGCNPIALGDRTTTNAEFAEMAGVSYGDVSKEFAFEFGEDMLRPALAFQAPRFKADVGIGGVIIGGHALYVGPRSPIPEGLVMSLQIGRTVNFPWNGAAPIWDVLQPLEPVMGPDITEIWFAIPANLRPADKPKPYQYGQNPTVVPASNFNTNIPGHCNVCGSSKATIHKNRICEECWLAFLGHWSCHKCKLVLDEVGELVSVTESHPTDITIRCKNCGAENWLSSNAKAAKGSSKMEEDALGAFFYGIRSVNVMHSERKAWINLFRPDLLSSSSAISTPSERPSPDATPSKEQPGFDGWMDDGGGDPHSRIIH